MTKPIRFATLAALALTASCATRGVQNFDCTGFAPVKVARSEVAEAIGGDGFDLLTESLVKPKALADDPLAKALNAAVARASAAALQESVVPQRPHAVLLLSGGGQWGAFGSGFLDALRQRGANEPQLWPRFDVVTGVSTGALQALFVGAGDRFLPKLLDRYSPDKESDIVSRNARPLALVTGSLAGLSPLRKRVEEALCPPGEPADAPCPVIAALAASPTQVFIGFVDAASGDMQYVDATAIAKAAATTGWKNAQQCLTGAALASAAMPGFFQQVRVAERTYYDGGVRQSVFEAALAEGLAEAQTRNPAAPPVPLLVLRNGPTTVRPMQDAAKTASVLDAAFRAEAIVVNGLEVGSVAALRLRHPTGPIGLVTADGYGSTFPGPGGAAHTGCVKQNEDAMFEPLFMRCLQALGAAKAGRAEPFRPLPPIRLPSRGETGNVR